MDDITDATPLEAVLDPIDPTRLPGYGTPIPEIAKAAIILAQANHQRLLNELAEQTLSAMNLSSRDGWRVFLDEGVARKAD